MNRGKKPMGPKFFQTIMGQRFIEGTIPAVLNQVKRLNENLERLNNNLERYFKEESDEQKQEDE
tara:strand:- start:269 stop:460 length:192 start_codon:yes stop_codon:yes gene_type:complete